MSKRKSKIKYTLVGLPGDPTQFRVEIHYKGLWSNQPEVRIRREFNGKVNRYGPSLPESTLDDLIEKLISARDDIKRSKNQD